MICFRITAPDFLFKGARCSGVDVVVTFDCDDRPGVAESVRREISERHPGYTVNVQLDSDLTD